MRFIRKGGRVIPIRESNELDGKGAAKLVGIGAASGAAGRAIAGTASSLKQRAKMVMPMGVKSALFTAKQSLRMDSKNILKGAKRGGKWGAAVAIGALAGQSWRNRKKT